MEGELLTMRAATKTPESICSAWKGMQPKLVEPPGQRCTDGDDAEPTATQLAGQKRRRSGARRASASAWAAASWQSQAGDPGPSPGLQPAGEWSEGAEARAAMTAQGGEADDVPEQLPGSCQLGNGLGGGQEATQQQQEEELSGDGGERGGREPRRRKVFRDGGLGGWGGHGQVLEQGPKQRLPGQGRVDKRGRGGLRRKGGKLMRKGLAAAAMVAADRQETGPPPSGLKLAQYLKRMARQQFEPAPAGTQVWVKVKGFCCWPAVIWAVERCVKRSMQAVIQAFSPGHHLVLFYGDHSCSWCNAAQIALPQPQPSAAGCSAARIQIMHEWAKKSGKVREVAAAVAELQAAAASPEAELERMSAILMAGATTASLSGKLKCEQCGQDEPNLKCVHCEHCVHSLCLQPPCLSAFHMPQRGTWPCPCCGSHNEVVSGERMARMVLEAENALEKFGLTPDWMIEAIAHKVFALPHRSRERPFIEGLLDPCTNSKMAPNVPAEKLYDRSDDGLKLANSWAGFYVLLNPDFRAKVAWRFVNRAIDEVENDSVPAVLLISRNSTDTAYFQRLRPYPRVHLRRTSTRFKDYDKTPIGFGVVVFCIAKAHHLDMYRRFFDAFSPCGEPNIPIDREFLQQPAFVELLARLRTHADEHNRDHWVQCCQCRRWRILRFEAARHLRDSLSSATWTCSMLQPPLSSCYTPLTKRELAGTRYTQSQDQIGVQIQLPAPPRESARDTTNMVTRRKAGTVCLSYKAKQFSSSNKPPVGLRQLCRTPQPPAPDPTANTPKQAAPEDVADELSHPINEDDSAPALRTSSSEMAGGSSADS